MLLSPSIVAKRMEYSNWPTLGYSFPWQWGQRTVIGKLKTPGKVVGKDYLKEGEVTISRKWEGILYRQK